MGLPKILQNLQVDKVRKHNLRKTLEPPISLQIKEMAKGYANGKNPIAVFLSLKNPYQYDADGMSCFGANYNSLTKAREDEHDGVIITNVEDTSAGQEERLIDTYITFSPNQIKSATENNGDFSQDNNDIRFSKSEPKESRVSSPDELTSAAIDRVLNESLSIHPVKKARSAVALRKVLEALDTGKITTEEALKRIASIHDEMVISTKVKLL